MSHENAFQAFRQRSRQLRSTALLLVQVFGGVGSSHRALFLDKLHQMDRKLAPALNRLAWTSTKAAIAQFLREAQKWVT